jgi:hypothetical protein
MSFYDCSTARRLQEEAERDVACFLRETLSARPNWQLTLDECRIEIGLINQPLADLPDAVDFTAALLKWIETTGAYPTTAVPGTGVPLDKTEAYLNLLMKFAAVFVPRGEASGNVNDFMVGLGYFADSVAKRITSASSTPPHAPHRVVLADRAYKGLAMGGFVSWLLLFQDIQEIHIVCDGQRIDSSSNDKSNVRCRYIRAVLHELGHAKIGINDFYKAPTGVPAPPEHECFAWIYANAIVGVANALRSRAQRLIGRADTEVF